VLDIEEVYTANPKIMVAEIKDWLTTVENEYGVKPIIYSYVNFYEKYLAGSFDDYPLWIAHYLEKGGPRITRDWTFWQHNEEGHVNGIGYPVDFDVFNGDSADLEKLKLR
jgi:lysozyme